MVRNFYTRRCIFDGRLKYPEYCKIVLVVDIADNIEDSVCYWYKLPRTMVYLLSIGQELFKDGPILSVTLHIGL